MTATLGSILRNVELGVFPAPDLSVSVVAAPSERDSCVVGLTAHIVVAADVSSAWVHSLLPSQDPSAPLNPPFLSALEKATGRRVNAIDALLLAPALAADDEREELLSVLVDLADPEHPRVRRAQLHRDEVRVFGHAAGGLVLVGRGVAGRLECAVEVPEEARGIGRGRTLARAARALVPVGSHVWAQVTPGNAASLRAFLAAGFIPVGSEALLVKH
ncbi:GNAT family N-acetyltransferase [Kribbella albertanoniae]|uniref:GNAT family N-acetyltransferase n=1 Tax=Kribbella albertanoniae TaxID=1266829 RepID=A0A4R4QGH9_9ACTN|nr:GNAT family N-acetyltransferase [Kribbella albertanoniae]